MLVLVLLLTLGLFLLTKGADYFIDSSSSLANKAKVPALVIGLTVVAFGTSAPELFVSSIASIKGSSDISIGNVIGSNLANILFILGIIAIAKPLTIHSTVINREIPFLFLTSIALWLLADDMLFINSDSSIISKSDALILLSFFSVFMYYLFSDIFRKRREHHKNEQVETDIKIKFNSTKKIVIYFFLGLLMLILGANITVSSAVDLARIFGLSEAVIALTIIAVGTSLPELVTSVIAFSKKETELAVGNIIGSSIFNNVFILGFSGTLASINFNPILRSDIVLMIFSSIFLLFLGLNGKKLTKKEGIVLILFYVFYLLFNFYRI